MSSVLKRKGAQVFLGVALATAALVTPLPASAVIRGSSFYTTVDGQNWTDSFQLASSIGGYLASVTSAEENQFIVANFGFGGVSNDGTWFKGWIGLNNTGAPSTQNWEWVNGELYNYSQWHIGRPSGSGNPYVYINMPGTNVAPSNNYGVWVDNGDGGDGKMQGIAEIPIAFSASQSTSPIEGSGLFTTSLFFSAGVGSNLINGETVYWDITGITLDDLASGSTTGFGVVTNGQLDITHSLLDDGLDDIENFIVTAFSDPLLRTSEYQIGSFSAPVRSATSSTASVPGPLPILGLSSVFYWTRRLRKRIKNNKATLRIASID